MNDYFNIKDLMWLTKYILPSIIIAFLVWLVLLIISVVRLIYISVCIKRSKEVYTLHSLVANPGKIESGIQKATNESFNQEANETFKTFCHKAGFTTKNILAKHIYAMFHAGLSGARLEIAELNKLTENALFGSNAFLKGISSIFIIMGLFGTLFGLSQSFSKLRPALSSLKQAQQTSTVASAIDALFLNIGNAFTPSIIGVGLTITSVILFSLYLKFVCLPLKNMLRYYTINYWVPSLYPTTTQNVLETLEMSEKQMRKNFKAANQVANFAEDIQVRFGAFGEQLSGASSVLSQLTNVLKDFESTSDKFNECMASYASKQGEAKELYEKIYESTRHFEEYIANGVEAINKLQVKIEKSNDSLNERMEIVVDSFEHFKKLNDINFSLAAAAEKSFESVSRNNLEIIESLKQPLVNSMNDNFSSITSAFTYELGRIVDLFARMDVPLQQSAKSISEVFGNLSKSYDNLYNLIGETVIVSNQKMLTENLNENKQLVKYVSGLIENISDISDFLKEQNLLDGFKQYKKKAQKKHSGVRTTLGKLFKRK